LRHYETPVRQSLRLSETLQSASQDAAQQVCHTNITQQKFGVRNTSREMAREVKLLVNLDWIL
jgi:hypothetical protein